MFGCALSNFSAEKRCFYLFDSEEQRQSSLRTKDKRQALQVVNAKNEALRQPALNLHLARAPTATDAGIQTRTWQHAFEAIIKLKTGPTRQRWESAAKEEAFDLIRQKLIMETKADHFLAVLASGGVSTNVHLRKLHNFALDMGWLPWPVIPKRQFPPVKFKEKRAITWEEHLKIVDREPNLENKAYYELLWHLGGAQSDVVDLKAEDVDWGDRVISFRRRKTGSPALIRFGPQSRLSSSGSPRKAIFSLI